MLYVNYLGAAISEGRKKPNRAQQYLIEMSMCIDEARHQSASVCIDEPTRLSLPRSSLTDLANDTILHGHIARLYQLGTRPHGNYNRIDDGTA